MEPEIAGALERLLHEYGFVLRLEGSLEALEPYALASASFGYQRADRAIRLVYAPRMTVAEALPREALRGPGEWAEHFLLLGPRVTERNADAFRNAGVNYLDAAGNAYLSFPPALLDVRGRQPLENRHVVAEATRRTGVHLMSPKRAQVVFALLSWEGLLSGPIRELAYVSKVSLGQAQQTLRLLEDQGFLSPNRAFLPGMRNQLLEQWVCDYPTALGAKQLQFALAGEIGLPLSSEVHLIVSGESAVSAVLRPETLTLYSGEVPRDLIRERRWRGGDPRPNVFLKQQFWEHPGEIWDRAAAASAASPITTATAPPLLVYADLLASKDSRQREVANEFRKQHAELRAS